MKPTDEELRKKALALEDPLFDCINVSNEHQKEFNHSFEANEGSSSWTGHLVEAFRSIRDQSFKAGEESGIRKAEGLAMQFVLGAYSSDTEAECENLRQAILSLLPRAKGPRKSK